MPESNNPPEKALDFIVKKIPDRIKYFVRPETLQELKFEIVQNFKVWIFKYESEAPMDTGQWHHQIKLIGNKPKASFRTNLVFGHSTLNADEPNKSTLDELIFSSMAEKINETYVWVQNNVPDYQWVRLLISREYQIWALWILGRRDNREIIVLISFPPIFKKELECKKLYDFKDFQKILNNKKPLYGIKPIDFKSLTGDKNEKKFAPSPPS